MYNIFVLRCVLLRMWVKIRRYRRDFHCLRVTQVVNSFSMPLYFQFDIVDRYKLEVQLSLH